jgi:type II secretory pathway component GspD/PulD (secretin)
MGTRFLPPWMQPQTPASSKSDRMTREATVRVVPDPRTASIIVTTSRDLMEQIAGVVASLDSSDAQVQHVYSYDINTADPTTVNAAMTALFAGQNHQNASGNQNQSALLQRQQNNAQQTTQSTTGFGTSGGGGMGGGTSAIP